MARRIENIEPERLGAPRADLKQVAAQGERRLVGPLHADSRSRHAGERKLRAHEIRGRLQFAFQFGLLRGQQPMRTIEIIARAFDFADQRIGSEAGLHPRQRPSAICSGWSCAVMSTTWLDRNSPSARIASQTLGPSRPGIIQSRITRSGRCARMAANPATPSSASMTR